VGPAMGLRFSFPCGSGIVPPKFVRVMAGRSTKNAPHNLVGVVGRKSEQPLPQKCRSATAKTFPPRDEWHVPAERWVRAGHQGQLSVAAERVVPRFPYRIFHLLLRYQKRKAGKTVSARFSAVDSASCAGAVSAATRSWP
jgi:hypothetical protein